MKQHLKDRKKHAANARKAKRKTHERVIEKPGVRPLSLMHPEHPARLYGWNSEQAKNRDLRVWA